MRKLLIAAALAASFVPFAAGAQTAPAGLAEVVCDQRLGSGALTSLNDGGYVLTSGHVVIDVGTRRQSEQCRVGFVTNGGSKPDTFFRATVVHADYDDRYSRDFALLRLGERITGNGALPSSPVTTNELAEEGNPVTVFGFPEGNETVQSVSGVIKGFRRGIAYTDAAIVQGYSGGPALDAQGRLVGVASRANYTQDADTGVQTFIDYDLADVLAVIAWMDSFAPGAHDTYLTHGNPAYHAARLVYRREHSGCNHVVQAAGSSSVFCLLNGPYRLVFPTEAAYYSWYDDFSQLKRITPANMAEYLLIGNVSMRAGSLIKIQTDPRVYVVTDSVGTIRWVPTEELAVQLFGAEWAKQVRDVPVEFFVNYRIGEAL